MSKSRLYEHVQQYINQWPDLKYTNDIMSGHYQGATITSKTIPSVSALIKHTIEENNKYVPPESLNWKDATGVSYRTRQPTDEEALHPAPNMGMNVI